MKLFKLLQSHRLAGTLMFAGAFLTAVTPSRANVYATDIEIGGALASTNAIPVGEDGQTTISYHLNQAATLGCTISVLDANSNLVTTIVGKTNMGLNTVVWGTTNSAGQPVPQGTYHVSITAAASGYTVWTQISSDSNPGNYNYYPHGIAVDNNSNSPYYGRVVVGCSLSGGTNPVSLGANETGIYKCNADGTPADEGNFGYGGYSTDDKGNVSTLSGQMPDTSDVVPYRLRVSDDDRIYMLDWSHLGAVVAFDMQVTTNQIVINEAGYSGSGDSADLNTGIINFDVSAAGTTNGAVWLCDSDFPNWGVWMYRLTNGAADPNDSGTQAVYAGSGSSLGLVSSGGCMVDTNLDIFVGQNRFNPGDTNPRAMVFSNWNEGILPPEGSQYNDADVTAAWTVGGADNYFEAGVDTVINSRTVPTVIAIPLANGATTTSGGGIRLLNVADGSVVTVTNGATVTTYTNLDYAHIYTSAAFDNVGNLYAASTSRNVWRVWTPPGASTNTTAATESMLVEPLPPTVALGVSTFSGDGNTNATPISASYSGTLPLTLQWYYNNASSVSNAVVGQVNNTSTSSTLALSNLTASENGNSYYLVASNTLGSATTTVATLTVYTTPQIMTNISPLNQTVSVGFTGSFSVSAVGSVPLSYQWYEDGNPIPGQTNATLVYTATSGSHTYYVNVSNGVVPSGINSSTATVTGAATGLPAYEPFTEYASQVSANGTNAIDLCTSGLSISSGDSLSTLSWGSLNYNGLGLNAAGNHGLDVLITNNSSTPFTRTALSPLLPTTFPGFPATSISVMAVNPAQPGAPTNMVGSSPVLVLANDFNRPGIGSKTIYMSYLISFAQKGQLGSGNDGRYLALLASSNLVEPSATYPFWGGFFNTFAGSPRYAAHGLLDIGTSNAYIGPCDCSAGKDFTTSLYTVQLGSNSPTGAPVFVVGAYTFNAGGQDVNSMWVNPSIANFGGATPPATPQNDLMPAGYNMSDIGGLCLIDRVGSGGAGGVGTNFVANLLVGTTWSYVTGGPEFTIQPLSQYASGNSVTLTANAVAAGQSVNYQWQHVTATATNTVNNGSGGAGGSATVTGANAATLALNGMSAADAGSYQVVAIASGTGYTLTSSKALVAVTSSGTPAPVQFATVPLTGSIPGAPVLHFSGTAGGTYHVWSTTNIALTPVEATWTLLGTGTFSGGADTFTCPAGGAGDTFYTITQP